MIEVEKCTKIRQKFISFSKYLPDVLDVRDSNSTAENFRKPQSRHDASQNTGALFFFFFKKCSYHCNRYGMLHLIRGVVCTVVLITQNGSAEFPSCFQTVPHSRVPPERTKTLIINANCCI